MYCLFLAVHRHGIRVETLDFDCLKIWTFVYRGIGKIFDYITKMIFQLNWF